MLLLSSLTGQVGFIIDKIRYLFFMLLNQCLWQANPKTSQAKQYSLLQREREREAHMQTWFNRCLLIMEKDDVLSLHSKKYRMFEYCLLTKRILIGSKMLERIFSVMQKKNIFRFSILSLQRGPFLRVSNNYPRDDSKNQTCKIKCRRETWKDCRTFTLRFYGTEQNIEQQNRICWRRT